MKRSQTKGVLILLLTAFIWGSAFVAQSLGARTLQGFTFNALRCLFALLFLIPVLLIRDGRRRKNLPEGDMYAYVGAKKNSIIFGVPLGVLLCLGSNLQQFAMDYTTPGKVAFITALYMILVPLIGKLFGRRSSALLWLSVLVSMVGLYFLTIGKDGFSKINFGDVLALLCAVAFCFHILLVDYASGKTDVIALSAVQFSVAGVVSAVLMVIFESLTFADFKMGLLPVVYAGVLSSGVAYTLQIVGQKHTEPTLAGLIMCAESVFGVLTAMVVLKQIPTVRETIGIVLMLAAIVSAQFAVKPKEDRRSVGV